MTRRWMTLGLVTFAAGAAGAPLAGAQQTPSPARVWVQCDGCADDSLAVLRAKVALEAATAQHDAVMRALEDANSQQQEALRRQASALQRQMAQLSRQLSAARPKGWIGLTFEGPQEMNWKDGKMLSVFPMYPEVVAVDPNSPADKAGIQRGDSLVRMNGVDLRKGVVLADFLRPNAHLRLTLRRDGKTKDVPVKVAKAPGTIVERRMALAPMPPMPPMPPMRAGVTVEVAPGPPPPGDKGEWSRGQATDGGVTRIFVFPRVDGLAGADMRTLDADLGESFGVNQGVLVVGTATSSPAREAGLRGGDVILTADGRPVRTVSELRAVAVRTNAASKEDRSLRLEVVRAGGKKRTVTLRW